MFDQMLEGFRKTSESSLQMQQDFFRQWAQQWLSTPGVAGGSTEWTRNIQKRWLDLSIEILNKHRESLDSSYRSGIQTIEQTLRVSDAKSPEDYRRTVEDLWRKSFETLKTQLEAQLREFQNLAEKSFAIVQNPT